MTPCCRQVEIFDHGMRLRENAVWRFLGLENRLLCYKEYVDRSVMVVDYIIVGWWLDIHKNVKETNI